MDTLLAGRSKGWAPDHIAAAPASLTTVGGMNRVRWGVIGAGDVVEHKSGPALQRAQNSELVAVMRRDRHRAEDFARRHNVPRWYGSADELIHDPEVDALYVATPPSSHQDYVERAAAAGKPVYVEKPMARTAAECRAMIAACEAAGSGSGVPLFVAYYRRAMPRFETARAIIQDGRLGDVRSIVVRNQKRASPSSAGTPWRLQPLISGGGLFVDLASHTFDWLDHVFGPIATIAGQASQPLSGRGSAETSVSATFTFASGVTGVGLWDYGAAERMDLIEVIGSEAALRFSCFGTEPLTLVGQGASTSIETPYPEIVQLPLIQQIVDFLTGRRDTVPSTGRTALRTAQTIDAVLAQYRAEQGISL